MSLLDKLTPTPQTNQKLEIVEYNISDLVIPFKLVRHVPKLLKEKDNVVRKCELAIYGILQTAQVFVYYNLIKMLG